MVDYIPNKIIPILLCGGSGTRLWPQSRASYPKQYLKYNLKGDFSFLQETYKRLNNQKIYDSPILIANVEHRFIAAQQMQEIGIKPSSIILEPYGKNTAPAVTIACLKALELDEEALILVLPADHSVQNVDKFNKAIYEGIKHANSGKIVTFGVKPNSPETGFGYIEANKELNFDSYEASSIKRFVEKPDKLLAEKFIKDKKFSWNSGIFLLKAKVGLDEIKKFSPDILEICRGALNSSIYDLDFQRLNKEIFEKCENVSFDISIMEKTDVGNVIPLNIGWSDLGNWESFWKTSRKDDNGNVIDGKIVTEKVKNCFFKSDKRILVGVDLEELIVVDSTDAVLVAKMKSSQKVKEVVGKMIKQDYKEANLHSKVFRPWGNYLSIAEDDGWQVKVIEVKPGASLSLQKHNYRAEHWIVVSGIAEVEIEEEKKFLKENQSIYIPIGYKHRLSNPGKLALFLIEVQSGKYLGEDDIIRFEDNYGRIDNFQI